MVTCGNCGAQVSIDGQRFLCALWREIAGDGNADHIPACGAGAEGAAVLWPMRCENQY